MGILYERVLHGGGRMVMKSLDEYINLGVL